MGQPSLVELVQLRQAEERTARLEVARGASLETEAVRCPVCGGPSRFGAKLPCRACRPVARCRCGCGRELWDRAEVPVARTCMVLVLRRLFAAPAEVQRQVLAVRLDEDGP